MPGIFITKGMRVEIPPGGLVISLSGPPPPLRLHVHFDVCPSWCQLALRHLSNAKACASERDIAWAGTDESAKALALEREFEASMQAIVAAAIALDAFYAVVQTKVALPPSLVEKWRTGRTARHSQIAQVLQRGFRISPQGMKNLKVHLKEVFRFRDLAIHPPGKIEAPLLHPELDVGVEWRFAYFRAVNAEAVVNSATAVIWQLSRSTKIVDEGIRQYVAGLATRMTELFPEGHPAFAQATGAAATSEDVA